MSRSQIANLLLAVLSLLALSSCEVAASKTETTGAGLEYRTYQAGGTGIYVIKDCWGDDLLYVGTGVEKGGVAVVPGGCKKQ